MFIGKPLQRMIYSRIIIKMESTARFPNDSRLMADEHCCVVFVCGGFLLLFLILFFSVFDFAST